MGFDLKKSLLDPVNQIEFLRLIIDTKKITLALSVKKLKHVSQQCQEIFTQPKTSILNPKKLTSMLSWTVQVLLPAQIQFQDLQQKQILTLLRNGSYSPTVVMWRCGISQEETPLVDWKLETLQWENSSAIGNSCDHSGRKGVSTRVNNQRRRSIL